ncbi:hypothetical protein RRG08_033784 [Elysia crispata]|uniref:Uncharacterized protein n=1 Tax=Elysia crispata TaxID=231223 RepID=A0AAE1ASE8_9GAST|nr:hypothetical protein RRG08_033784 [Elysia crispata]
MKSSVNIIKILKATGARTKLVTSVKCDIVFVVTINFKLYPSTIITATWVNTVRFESCPINQRWPFKDLSMDIWACNWTCPSFDHGIHGLADITLTLLLTLKVGLLGIIYDDRVASEVSQLMPRLANRSNVILFLADDIIRDQAIARSYLDFAVRQLDGQSPVSLIMTKDVITTHSVFDSFSRQQAWLGRQSGVGLYTKWLVVTPSDDAAALERGVHDFYNVGAIIPKTNLSHHSRTREAVIKTLIVKPDGKRLETVGAYSEGSVTLWAPVFPNVDRGLNKMHMIVGVYVWAPFTMRVYQNGNITYEGFSVDLVTELARRLNFSFTMVEPADNEWGRPLADGTWTGIVGMLQKHEIDISVAALVITTEREEVMDATFPYYYDNVAVIYKRPDPKENLWKTYFYPFQTQVYVFIVASIGGASILYALVALVSPRSPTHTALINRKWSTAFSATEKQSTWLTCALIHQSHTYLPKYGSARMFLAFWWIFAILLAATYKGNLMAFLLVAKTERPFTTLWDLGTQNVYKWGVTGSTVVEYLFKISNRSDFQKLGEGLEIFKAADPETNSTDPDVHLRKVKEGQYAYISDQVPMEMWVAVDCDLRILEERVIPLPFIVGLHNNSALVTAFNQQLLDIDQMGLYNQWKTHWWPLETHCSDDSGHESRAVTLLETQAAFYILCIGLSLAIAALIGEYVWTRGLCVLLRRNISDGWWGRKL